MSANAGGISGRQSDSMALPTLSLHSTGKSSGKAAKGGQASSGKQRDRTYRDKISAEKASQDHKRLVAFIALAVAVFLIIMAEVVYLTQGSKRIVLEFPDYEEDPMEPKPGVATPRPSRRIINSFERLQEFYGGKQTANCGLRSVIFIPDNLLDGSGFYTGPLKRLDQPWFLGVYRYITKRQTAVYLCSATLVGDGSLVLTSASCAGKVYTFSSYGGKDDADNQWAVVGGHTSEKVGHQMVEKYFTAQDHGGLVRVLRLETDKERARTFYNDKIGLLRTLHPFEVPYTGPESRNILINTACLPPPSEDGKLPAFVPDKGDQKFRVEYFEAVGKEVNQLEDQDLTQMKIDRRCSKTGSIGDKDVLLQPDELVLCPRGTELVCRYRSDGSLLLTEGMLFASRDKRRFYAVGSTSRCYPGKVGQEALYEKVGAHAQWIANRFRN